jgi:hypothetical protein
VDSYVNGDMVPYAELRRVWSDQVGWFPLYLANANVIISDDTITDITTLGSVKFVMKGGKVYRNDFAK